MIRRYLGLKRSTCEICFNSPPHNMNKYLQTDMQLGDLSFWFLIVTIVQFFMKKETFFCIFFQKCTNNVITFRMQPLEQCFVPSHFNLSNFFPFAKLDFRFKERKIKRQHQVVRPVRSGSPITHPGSLSESCPLMFQDESGLLPIELRLIGLLSG